MQSETLERLEDELFHRPDLRENDRISDFDTSEQVQNRCEKCFCEERGKAAPKSP